MALIKTYPLKNNYYGPDRLILSDMQPDSEGNVSGDTKNLTLANLKSFIGSGSAPLILTTTGTSGAATFDVNTNTLNVPVYEGDTYNLRALQKSSNSVPLKLNAATGTDSEVSFTEGANITLTRNSDTEITISATGGNAGVGSITNAFGTYITGTTNTAATGAVGLGTIDLNATNGTSTATTRFLSKDNTWDVISASGSDTQMQYNNGGAFGGTTGLTWDDSTNVLSIGTRFEGDINGALLQQVIVKEVGGVSKGDIVYISGGTGDNPEVKKAQANASITMPALGIMKANTAENETGESITSGEITGLGSLLNGISTGDELFVSNTTAGGFQTSAPTGEANLIQKIGKVIKGGNGGALTVLGAFRTNATPNLNQGSLFIGNASNQSTILGIGGNNTVLTSNGTTATWATPQGLTSVGLSAPPAFSVTGSPLTSNGSISIGVTGGSAGEFLAYNGQWATPTNTTYSVMGSGNSYAAGLVLAGSSTHSGNFLRKDGTWGVPAYPNPSAPSTTNLAALSINGNVYGIPQGTGNGTITSVQAGVGISGGGSSGIVTVTNSDRGSSQLFYKTFITDNGNNVVASANEDTITITGGAGITTSGSGDQISIANNQATNIERGGVKLFTSTVQSVNATGTSSTAGRTYGIQLNSNGQAVVNVPWTSGGGGGISFSGSTVDGLTTYSNSTTAVVNSQVRLTGTGFMTFDGSSEGTGVDFYSAGATNILRFGDLTGDTASTVELWTDGSRQFEIGVNGEIGLGTGASQGTSGQVLTSQGNGSPAIWSSNSTQNIANTNLTQTANRTYAMSTYALTFTGTSTISMQNSNGLVVSGNIISNSQSYAAKNSIPNKNTSFTVDFNDGNVQQVNLTNGSGNVIIGFTNIRAGARYTIITTRLGYEGTFGTYSFNSVLWPNNVTPVNVPTGSGLYNMYEFVATTTSASGMLGYAFRNYQTAS